VPTPPRRLALLLLAGLTGLAAAPFVAHAHAEVGTPVPAVELTAASGEKVKLLDPGARVSVLVFVRTGQERSTDALKAMARCEKALAGKPVRFLGLLPGDTPAAEARALAQATGVKMPLALDEADALYEKLLVRLHPVIYLVDARGQVAAFEQYRQIDYCEVILARIRFMLGELDQAALDGVLAPTRNSLPGDDPRDVSTRDVNLGRRQLRIKQYDKAVASANKALGLSPSAAAFALLGDVAAARGDCGGALKHYASALKLDPAERYALAGQRACAGK
jgi:tetratricopeptide (TPR) repeat protein